MASLTAETHCYTGLNNARPTSNECIKMFIFNACAKYCQILDDFPLFVHWAFDVLTDESE